MGTKLMIGGCDPSLSNWGMIKGELDLESGEFKITDSRLIETKPSTVKNVRKNSMDLNRAVELYRGFTEFFMSCAFICVEIPVGSQSA